MCGNVSEWCYSNLKPYTENEEESRIDSNGVNSEKSRIYKKAVRGGNWNSPNAVFIIIKKRDGFFPNYSDYRLGFRCAMSADSCK